MIEQDSEFIRNYKRNRKHKRKKRFSFASQLIDVPYAAIEYLRQDNDKED